MTGNRSFDLIASVSCFSFSGSETHAWPTLFPSGYSVIWLLYSGRVTKISDRVTCVRRQYRQ